MSDQNEQIAQLNAELSRLKDELQALKAGNAAALAAISAALREIPGYKMLTHALKHSWPLSDVTDNEITETTFSAPLRFLLNDQQQARSFFRGQ